MRHILLSIVLFWTGLIVPSDVLAGTWTYTWPSQPGGAKPQASVSPFLYGKSWAYSFEIDDGSTAAKTFVQPFFAKYEFTDAPPGVAGGTVKPFVGGAAVIVHNSSGNSAHLKFEDLRWLQERGWGVINHSYAHSGRSWGNPPEILTEAQIRRDLFWSQTILATELGGRAPTHFVYPNGYMGYRGPWMAEYGITTASRVGGSSDRDPTSPKFQPLDLARNYLDEGAWANGGKGEPMHGFPKDGPKAGQVIIDFTHGIDAKPESANQRRWTERLTTIASTHGRAGRDDVWCAPTGDVYAYVAARKDAKLTVGVGELTVTVPEGKPGSPLTIELTGIPSTTDLPAVPNGSIYRKEDRAWITFPAIEPRGSNPPRPDVQRIYSGPVKAMTWDKPIHLAAVRMLQSGPPKNASPFEVKATSPSGEVVDLVPDSIRTLPRTWGLWHLLDVLPAREPIAIQKLEPAANPSLVTMEIWAVEAKP